MERATGFGGPGIALSQEMRFVLDGRAVMGALFHGLRLRTHAKATWLGVVGPSARNCQLVSRLVAMSPSPAG
jgi:hypothetical protein